MQSVWTDAAGEAFAAQVSSTRGADLVDLAWLNGHAAQWDQLVADSSDASPFFSRAVVNAHALHNIGPKLKFIVARDGTRLLGLLPFVPKGARLGWAARCNVAWQSPLTTASTPLVPAGALRPALSSLLDRMAEVPGSLWSFPDLNLDSEVAAALCGEVARRCWPSTLMGTQERAIFNRKPGAPPTLARQKDLRRRRRRLGELGTVRHVGASSGDALMGAIDKFLALEAGGWKGQRGTALASRPDTASFARDLFAPSSGPVHGRADLLLLDDQAVAASLALICGGTAYLLKCAYDERFARYAPGILLEEDIIREMYASGFAERLNSASQPGGVLDGLYPDREKVGTLLFATDPDYGDRIAVLARRELARRQTMRQAKDFYWRLKDRFLSR